MLVILHIETSTEVCSVALSKDGSPIFSEITTQGPSHAVQLGVFVDKALTFLEQHSYRLDAVAVSGGPGSYTGLRIGASMAKGICYAKGIPLISVPTLSVLAQQALPRLLKHFSQEKSSSLQIDTDKFLLCPMLDARRMEVYTAVYEPSLQQILPVQALVVDENSFSEWPEDKMLCFFGNGADKIASIIKREQVYFEQGLYPRAEDMVLPAEAAYREQRFEDIAYYEPFYLKEFQATVPKKMNQLIYNK